jgi:hypothetical protein
MNPRIRALAEQAGAVNVWEWASDDVLDTKSMDAEKFAELIVQECLDIVEGEDDGSADTKSVRLTMIRMKQHFGVAE